MAVVKDLGVATAYAYAVQGGYTGTEEEFAELLARQATVAAEAAASADAAAASATAAAGSESNASASAVAAAQSESNAASSESNAAGSASSASTSAATATTQAGNASSSATAASGSATAAANSASAAATSKTDAQAAATSAASSAAAAQTAQTAAETAQDAAEDARDRAEAAAASLDADQIVYKDDLADATVGNARQLVAAVGIEETTPYNFRTSGGSIDIGDRETDMLVGGTVCWNQLAKNGNFASTSNWSKFNVDLEVAGNVATVTKGAGESYGTGYLSQNVSVFAQHKYLEMIDYKNEDNTTRIRVFDTSSSNIDINDTAWHTVSLIVQQSSNATFTLMIWNMSENASADMVLKVRNCIMIDLTQMFGSAIADYIYNLERTTAGAGVAWFKKLFPKDYYAYNAGELMSVKASAHKMVGLNAWDEEWEVGALNTTTGANIAEQTTQIRSKNYIPVVPNMSYYFANTSNNNYFWFMFYDKDKNVLNSGLPVASNSNSNARAFGNAVVQIPNNCHYIRFYTQNSYGSAYKNDICINLSWDGERDGEYEEYKLNSYPLDESLELRGIPRLSANNDLYYDGDTYESDGTVTRLYEQVLIDGGVNGRAFSGAFGATDNGYAVYVSTNTPARAAARSSKFVYDGSSYTTMPLYTFGGGSGTDTTWIFILPSSVTSLAAANTWAQNNPFTVVWKKNTPTIETADPYINPQIVDDFGTEEYVDAAVEANERDVAIPVGHVTQYMNNLRGKLEMAPDSPDGDGDYLVRQTNGENTYVQYTDGGRITNLESAQEDIETEVATLEDWLGYSLTDVPGVQIDFENNKWTRLGAAVGLSAGSDFDQFNAFGGRRRCNVADDGTVNAYYGDEGYAEDGSNGQVMVEQPKFYYRVVPLKLHKQAVGTGYDMLKANYYISDTPRKGFKLHPAFINESGKEVPCVYIGAAKACIYDTSASEYNLTDAQTMAVAEDKLSSIFGAKPASGLSQQFTRPNVETLAQNRGTGWHGETSKVKMATILLMFVEGAGNLQTVFGQGVSTITDNSSYNCASITGSTSALGNASGSATSTVNEINGTETTYTTSGRVSISYRGEEDPYGNIYEFLYDVNVWGDGTMQGGQAYVCTDFNFAESKRTDNYEGCGWCFPATSGYIKYFGYGNGDYDWLLAPSSNGGSSSLPIGDYDYVTADLYGFRVASFGGDWRRGARCGLCWGVDYGVGYRSRSIGARLEYYPQIAA